MDNFAYFCIKTYVVGAHYNRLGEAILMSTHTICFYEDLTKLSFNYHQISSNRHIISSSDSRVNNYYLKLLLVWETGFRFGEWGMVWIPLTLACVIIIHFRIINLKSNKINRKLKFGYP